MPAKNVVDSSGWIEYFADGLNADFFEAAVEDASALIVPAISIYEVSSASSQNRAEKRVRFAWLR